jgi:hypothetical protein
LIHQQKASKKETPMKFENTQLQEMRKQSAILTTARTMSMDFNVCEMMAGQPGHSCPSHEWGADCDFCEWEEDEV